DGTDNTAAGVVAVAFTSTMLASATGALGWLIVQQIRLNHQIKRQKDVDDKPAALGASFGAIAGLVAITPACAFVETVFALLIGLVAGGVCAWAEGLKRTKFGYSDSMDVVAVHLVGGLVGTLLTGFFATTNVNNPTVEKVAGKGGLWPWYGGA